MAFSIPNNLFRGYAPGSPTVVYTCPSNTRTIVTSINVANNANQKALKMWIVPNGQALSDAYLIIPDTDIAGNEWLQATSQSFVLAAGDTIHLDASGADSIAMSIDGVERDIS
jgi:hypothetical protein